MNDDFESLKKLGAKLNKKPSSKLINHWAYSSAKVKVQNSVPKKTNWWQLAAALLAGLLIGKFLLQSHPEFLSTMANNKIEDETFESIYINN